MAHEFSLINLPTSNVTFLASCGNVANTPVLYSGCFKIQFLRLAMLSFILFRKMWRHYLLTHSQDLFLSVPTAVANFCLQGKRLYGNAVSLKQVKDGIIISWIHAQLGWV